MEESRLGSCSYGKSIVAITDSNVQLGVMVTLKFNAFRFPWDKDTKLWTQEGDPLLFTQISLQYQGTTF